MRRRLALAAAAGAAVLASCGPGAGPTPQAAPTRVPTPAVPPAPAATASPASTGSGVVTARILAGVPGRPISPLIYGVAAAQAEDLAALRPALHRWGGNPASRYNWELGNAWNSARDWEFRNGNYGNTGPQHRLPSGTADQFVAMSRAAGAEPLITVPALGWVARDDRNESRSMDVPRGGGPALPGPLGALSPAGNGYDPAANRAATSLPSYPRKGAPFAYPPDLRDGKVFQDEWVHHLVTRFGTARSGGVRYFAVDNEPDLWDVTHTDVHPEQLGYDDLLQRFLDTATAIKDVDPDARVLGPTLSGWTGYFFSPRDRGVDNFRTHPDRRAHGEMPLLPWFLEQVKRHDERDGRRSLDVLDIHYYPQAQNVYGDSSDPATSALRLRSTRSLWDPAYADESWIGDPVRLIPRMREWIDRYYPGTQLGIGEWSWGAEKSMSGGLAIADVLGIFGREGVDLAAYWTFPPQGSPTALAFSLYTGADQRAGGFGSEAIPVQTTARPDDISVYASRDAAKRDLVMVAINKRSDRDMPLTIQVDGVTPSGEVRAFQISERAPALVRQVEGADLTGGHISLGLPPWSVTLIRVRF